VAKVDGEPLCVREEASMLNIRWRTLIPPTVRAADRPAAIAADAGNVLVLYRTGQQVYAYRGPADGLVDWCRRQDAVPPALPACR
jgi:hypothetical protein